MTSSAESTETTNPSNSKPGASVGHVSTMSLPATIDPTSLTFHARDPVIGSTMSSEITSVVEVGGEVTSDLEPLGIEIPNVYVLVRINTVTATTTTTNASTSAAITVTHVHCQRDENEEEVSVFRGRFWRRRGGTVS